VPADVIRPSWANVLRLVLGESVDGAPAAAGSALLLSTNVDDSTSGCGPACCRRCSTSVRTTPG
jgi:hypothetical protein